MSSQVFVVGSGDCGQLGLGPDVLEKERPALLSYFDPLDIVQISAGGLHNLALSKDGKVYSWGCNDQFALGRTGEETMPAPVEFTQQDIIIQIASGDSISAALTREGKVYTWGTFRDKNGIFGCTPNAKIEQIPVLIPELKNIIQIDAGANHVVAVDKLGKVYTWGVGEQGQLGRKVMTRHAVEASLTPRPINFRPKKMSSKFNAAYCGGYHTFLVHESGAVFAFGLNNHGQLGIGSLPNEEDEEDEEEQEDQVDSPQEISIFNGHDFKIKSIVGGEHHSMALDDQGRVWVWGRGDSGQLGLSSSTSLSVPTLLSLPAPCLQISAGGSFSLARTNEKGDNIYGWGYGEMGQLANGCEDAMVPFRMNLKSRVVLGISAGGQHSVLLLNFKS